MTKSNLRLATAIFIFSIAAIAGCGGGGSSGGSSSGGSSSDGSSSDNGGSGSGYKMTWSLPGAVDGGATFAGTLNTCNYPLGPWSGEMTIKGSAAGAPIDLSGTVMDFKFPAGGQTHMMEIVVLLAGSITIRDEACLATDFLNITFIISDTTKKAIIRAVSSGDATASCPKVGTHPLGALIFPQVTVNEDLVPAC